VPPPEPHSQEYVTLKEYFERLISEQAKAVDKAENALSKRLEGMNEFRDTLRDQASQFVTVKEMNAKNDAFDNRLKALEQNRANLEGRFWAISAAVTLINVGMAIVSFLLR
jgi:ABC-type transporter Mla subunit MlaD